MGIFTNQNYLQNLFANFKRKLTFGGVYKLPNDQLLNTTICTDSGGVTNLYGWNQFNGSLASAAWIGGNELTGVGTPTFGTDHLGNANNAVVLNGSSQCVHTTGTTFDDTGSFTIEAKIKFLTAIGTDEYIFTKWKTNNADKSFVLVRLSTGHIKFIVWYNTSDGSKEITSSFVVPTDGNFHTIIAVYDQASKSMGISLDGVCAAYLVDSTNLGARNNSADTDLTFGAYDGSGTPSGFLACSIADMFYQKVALTADQVRERYLAGASAHGKLGTKGVSNGQVFINEKQPVNIIDIQNAVTVNIATGNTIVEQQFIPEDGYYRILQNITYNNDQANTTALRYIVSSIYSNAVSLSQSWGQILVVAGGSSYESVNVLWEGHLEKDDIIYSYGAASANTIAVAKYSQVSIERIK